MNNNETIERFYSAFANGDVEGMVGCYHNDVVFQDPAFGRLEGDRAVQMWRMLLSRKKDNTKINHTNVQATQDLGSAEWRAEYQYGPKNRNVINHVGAKFKFKDGKIIEHIDTFDLWKWTKQAIGLPGYLLGWTSFMKSKIQKTTNKQLDDYIGQQ